MAKISCFSAAVFGSAHPSGTGLIDAMTLGSIQTIATLRVDSEARTRPATLIEDDSCTSADVAEPTARWLVAINPLASTTTADARAVGVHSATTLSCHRGNRKAGSASSGGALLGAPLPPAALGVTA